MQTGSYQSGLLVAVGNGWNGVHTESSDDGVDDGGGEGKASSEDLEVEQCVLDD